MVEGPYQHFKDSFLSAWRDFNSADLCRRGFRGGALLDFRGSMQLFDSSHVSDRDKALLRAILSVEFGMFFSWAMCEEKTFHVVLVGVRMEMVTCFGSVLTSLWLLSRRVLSFMTLPIWMRLFGPDAFFGMVGCQPCLELMMVIPGQWMLRMLLLSVWRLLFALMLERAGRLMVCFPLLRVMLLLLTLLMYGLMGVWFWMLLLELVLLGVVFTPMFLVLLGSPGFASSIA